MTRIERLQSPLVALAALSGLGIGVTTPAGAWGEYVVLPALMLMITAVFVRITPATAGSLRQAGPVVAASLVLNYLVTPGIAWALGALLLGDHPDLRIGLLLLLVTPCTDWYLVFTAAARGHTGIAAALLPVNMVLQLLLLPVYIMLLGGQAATLELGVLVEAIVLVLLVPAATAAVLRALTARRGGGQLQSAAGLCLVPLLCLAVLAIFSWQAPAVVRHSDQLLVLLLPLLIFFTAMPALAAGLSHVLGLPGSHRVTLVMVTTARNSPIALGIAVAAFPQQPMVAIALALAPVVELPVLAVISQIVRRRGHKVGR